MVIKIGKIDEVSRVLGNLEGAVKEIKNDTVQIRDHLKQINGKMVKNDKQTTENTTNIKNLWGWINNHKVKLGGYGAGGGSLAAAVLLFIKWLVSG